MLAEAHQRDRLVGEADAALDRVREVDQARRLVVDADVDDLGVEDLLDLVADDVVDRLQLELAGERRLDAVDQRELGVPLPGLLDRAGAGERRADVLADEREQVAVRARRTGAPPCRTGRRGRRSSGPRPERDPEPAGSSVVDADELDLALLDQLEVSARGK